MTNNERKTDRKRERMIYIRHGRQNRQTRRDRHISKREYRENIYSPCFSTIYLYVEFICKIHILLLGEGYIYIYIYT